MTQWSVPDVLHLGHFSWKGRGKAQDGSVLALPWRFPEHRDAGSRERLLPPNSVNPASPLIALL